MQIVSEIDAPAQTSDGQRRHAAQTGSLHRAVKRGVARVRILPAEHAEVLPGFYVIRLNAARKSLRAASNWFASC